MKDYSYFGVVFAASIVLFGTLGYSDTVAANVNNAPTITGLPATSVEAGKPYRFIPSASDPDGDTLTFAISNKPAWANFSSVTGYLAGRPRQSDLGTTTGIVISVSDGSATTSRAPFDITVTGANDAPTISGAPATTVSQDTPYSFLPHASDADGDLLTFTISNKPAWAYFSTWSGRLSGTPRQANVGTTRGIVIRVSDGSYTTSLAAFDLTVTSVNGAPTLTGTPATGVVEDTAYNFVPSASDPDGDTLSFTISNKPAWASFNASTGRLSGTPRQGDVGITRGIVIRVSDGSHTRSLPAFDISVTNVNDAPSIAGMPITTVTAGSGYSFLPVAQDADGDSLNFSITNKPAWASFNANTGALSGTPVTVGTTDGIVISVSDGTAMVSLKPFSLTVAVVPDAGQPLVLYTFEEGNGSIVRDISGVGAPLDLTISDTSAVRWDTDGSLSINASTLIASSGAATKLSDALRASNAITLEAWIRPANFTQRGPARIISLSENISRRNFTLGQDESSYDMRLRTTGTDTNGTPSVSSAAGTASTVLSHVVYTRDAGGTARMYINGVKQLTTSIGGDFSNWESAYRLSLGNELTGGRPWTGTLYRIAIYAHGLSEVQVDEAFAAGYGGSPSGGIGSTDNAPVAKKDKVKTTVNSTVTIAPLENDRGVTDAPVSLEIIEVPDNGTLIVYSDDTIDYTPDNGFSGTDSFAYLVEDADGDVATAMVSITVMCDSCSAPVSPTMTLSWQAGSAPVLGYRIYYGTSATTATSFASEEQTTAVSYDAVEDLGLQADDTVCFRARAYNTIGESGFSETVCSFQ